MHNFYGFTQWFFSFLILGTTFSLSEAQVSSVGSQTFESQGQLSTANNWRSIEYRVEIAWWSDAVTMPYYLDAVVGPHGLELRGYVPNKSVRRHVVQLAKLHGKVPVRDRMLTYGREFSPGPVSSPAIFKQQVAHALRKLFPQLGPGLHAYCGLDGKIVVSGKAKSLNEKWAISNALRQIPGCTSIVNQMTVAHRSVPKVPDHDLANGISAGHRWATEKPNSQSTGRVKPIAIPPIRIKPVPQPVKAIPITEIANQTLPMSQQHKPIGMDIPTPEPIMHVKNIAWTVPQEPKTQLPQPPVLPEIAEKKSNGEKKEKRNLRHDAEKSNAIEPAQITKIAHAVGKLANSMDSVFAVCEKWSNRVATARMPTAKEATIKNAPSQPAISKSKTASPSDNRAVTKPATKYPISSKKLVPNLPIPHVAISTPIFDSEDNASSLPPLPSGKKSSVKSTTKYSTPTPKLNKSNATRFGHGHSLMKLPRTATSAYHPLYESNAHLNATQSPIAQPLDKKKIRAAKIEHQIIQSNLLQEVKVRFLTSERVEIRFNAPSRKEGVRLAEQIRRLPGLRVYQLNFQVQLVR